jgi:hypothetical protein
VAMWWERCIKNQIQRFVRAEERNRHFQHIENHLHECLYDLVRSDMTETDKFLELNRYKARLVQLHATRREKTMLDTSEHSRMDEEPSLFHLIKTLRRRNTRAIQHIQDSHRRIETRPQEVTNIFLNHLRKKFRPIDRLRLSPHTAGPYTTTRSCGGTESGTTYNLRRGHHSNSVRRKTQITWYGWHLP